MVLAALLAAGCGLTDPAPDRAETSPPPPGAAEAAPEPAPTAAEQPTTAPDPGSDDTDAGDAPGDDAVAQALALLDTLEVKGRAPKTGYSRDQFGPAWTDAVAVGGGRNGCDTRNDILGRDLEVTEFRSGTRECTVLTGVLDDPFTGERIEFTRGQDTSMAVQIDHVVAFISDRELLGAKI